MAMVINPSFDLRTPEKIIAFIRRYNDVQPNAKKSVHDIQANDIVYIDQHPCKISDPPNITHLEGLSGAGYEDPKDEKLILLCGFDVIDGKEYGQLYSLEEKVEHFIDEHDEREWLVICLQGMRVILQAPLNQANKWMMWMHPERSPCFWLLAREMPGKVYFRIYRQMGLNVITGARDAPGIHSRQIR